ncbi:MAG: hypothetical protein GXP33_04780 [Spirochaetes bacterium]|nr:hypothetical protein [Spirochaetota bacterium]
MGAKGIRMPIKIRVAIAINKKLQEQIFKEELRKSLSSFAEASVDNMKGSAAAAL